MKYASNLLLCPDTIQYTLQPCYCYVVFFSFFPSVCHFIMAALMAPVPSLNDMQNVTVKLIMTFVSQCEYCYYTAGKHKKKEEEKKKTKSLCLQRFISDINSSV